MFPRGIAVQLLFPLLMLVAEQHGAVCKSPVYPECHTSTFLFPMHDWLIIISIQMFGERDEIRTRGCPSS